MRPVRRHLRSQIGGRRRLGVHQGSEPGRVAATGEHGDDTLLMLTVASGAAADLAHLSRGQRALLPSVPLHQGREHDPADRQVQPHADRIRGDQGGRVALAEAPAFRAPHLGAERAVDHGDRTSACHELLAEGEDLPARKGHHRVRIGHRRQPDGFRGDAQGALAFKPDHLHRFVAELRDPADQRQAVRSAEHDHLARRDAHDRCGPSSAAVGIGQHLRLVDHRHVHGAAGMRHLHGAGDVPGPWNKMPLLPCHEAGRHAARGQRILEFQGQQAERRQGGAACGGSQPVQRVMRLAGVGGADHHGDAPVQRPRLGKMRSVAVEPGTAGDRPVRNAGPRGLGNPRCPAGHLGQQGGDLVGVELQVFASLAAAVDRRAARDRDQALRDPPLDQLAGSAEQAGQRVCADQLAFPLAQAPLLRLLHLTGALPSLAGCGATAAFGGDQPLAKRLGGTRIKPGRNRGQVRDLLDGRYAGRAPGQRLDGFGRSGENRLDVHGTAGRQTHRNSGAQPIECSLVAGRLGGQQGFGRYLGIGRGGGHVTARTGEAEQALIRGAVVWWPHS